MKEENKASEWEGRFLKNFGYFGTFQQARLVDGVWELDGTQEFSLDDFGKTLETLKDFIRTELQNQARDIAGNIMEIQSREEHVCKQEGDSPYGACNHRGRMEILDAALDIIKKYYEV